MFSLRSIAVLLGIFSAHAVLAQGTPGPVQVVPDGFLRDARQPQVAVSPLGKVYVVYGAEGAVYSSASLDGGKSYAPPVRVGEVGGLHVGMRRGPRVAVSNQAVVVTAIGSHEKSVVSWRSTDGGKTWQGPVTINRVAGSTPEGLHGLAAAPDGTVYCVWLDLRERKGQQVYGASSTDGGATWNQDRLIYASPDGGICPCCQPVVNYDLKGNLHVMWRNDVAGARDMYTVSSSDHGRTFTRPIKLGEGTWLQKT